MRSRWAAAATCLVLAATLVLATAAEAAGVEVGRIALVSQGKGERALLVPVSYPIEIAGHGVELRLRLLGPGGALVAFWNLRQRTSSGPPRVPDRRRRFTFVHRVELGPALSRRVRRGFSARADAHASLDVDRDGRPELGSRDRSVQALEAGASGEGLCSTAPRLRVRPGRQVTVPLPVCESPRDWGLLESSRHGRATIRDGHLVYRPARGFRGTETIRLVGALSFGRASRSRIQPLVRAYVQVTVGTAGGVVVRALGDSVTAGFGYYDDGSAMTIGHLLECRPREIDNDDACSSNSTNRNNRGTRVEYAPDYGLANNVSWAAQWANAHGITNYENFAVSGSEPSNWTRGGEFHSTTARIESEDPDYLLITIGANPLLTNMLSGIDHMGCAIWSSIFGNYRECIEEAFAEVHLRANLKSLYTDLVEHTSATIYVMQYHLSVPAAALAYSATQIAEMGKLLNREIASVAAEVDPQRLQVVTPPHFDVGIDISPVFPSRFSCSWLGFKVDGPSVQAKVSQAALELFHPLSFCSGPPSGPPWVIGGDTGIHPSAAGYAQMASQVPPPQP
jgi:lysophospholipase L1-like esterase